MKYGQFFPFVVEDDDRYARILMRAFHGAGVPNGNVRRYRDGEGALADLFTTDVVHPSAVVLDVELPGMSGFEILQRIRSWGPLVNLPAFVLTGSENADHVASARALRVRGYWRKPWNVSELHQIVEAMLTIVEEPGRAVRLPRSMIHPER